MTEALEELQRQALGELATAKTEEDLQSLRIKYLGRKGQLTKLLRDISSVPAQERPLFGKRCNEIKDVLTAAIESALGEKAEAEKQKLLLQERIDVTLPGRGVRPGRLHPITQIRNEICEFFSGFGFPAVEGPEVELDYYNFEALNIPKNHPARDMQDTFYIEENIVLRTHTSPVQVRVMEKRRPPLRILSPGRVYRRDSDISHTPMFHQIEGLLVDRGITFSDLKGLLTAFLKQVFGEGTELRFRPSFFPFTEPSAVVDIQCVICGGDGCRLCGQSGWIEILGSG
ncbi:MAG: phenylalanine--tRNA ligase subunit alpha, partial [Syntrophales bacterium LBB04]|nr:phenylalanine--tRNA ligase subunit alpha [Syntrophales bacterium LBB04]